MRLLFAFAALLAFASPVSAAIYDFNFVTGSAPSEDAIFMGYIDLGVPTNGQTMTFTLAVSNPDNAPYEIDESIEAISYMKNGNGVVAAQYQGEIDTINPCSPAICTGLIASPSMLSLGSGATRLLIVLDIRSPSNNFTADFALTVPDELRPSAIASVPEPSTWAMMLVGFVVIAFGINKRRLHHAL